MTRLVLDTNVIVSSIVGFNRPESSPGKLLRLWSARRFTWCVSIVIFDEVKRTLSTPYFMTRIPDEERADALETLETRTEWVEVTAVVSGMASHPEDDRILATALSARADILVTGDTQLLALGTCGTTRIMTVRETLNVLEGQ